MIKQYEIRKNNRIYYNAIAVCVKCHDHRNSECNERQLNKCINCIRANG